LRGRNPIQREDFTMRRDITIAAVTAVVLIGGGSYTAFATGDRAEDHGRDGRVLAARTAPAAPGASAVPGASGARTALTASEAAAAALKEYPGTIASVEREDRAGWEVELLGGDGTWRELKIDARTGVVRVDDRDRGDDGRDSAERKALSGAGVGAERAAAAALASTPGSVAEIDLDDDGTAHWEVEVIGKDHTRHELRVDARTAEVTADRNHDGDDHAGHNDRADHDDD
jgi:uncharacterized membrane protein YkoI